uniref:ribosomal protein S19 n=1 Tax=Cryptomonas pyrenoidifera TaxID=233184 RepID=UPI00226CBDD1|nr:ribosomal protein S19 [Cryptomonas pyrenoidifera]UZP15130.1 ribosomal protein S19 [Cryptomonas pyrenoidifera]
MPRSTWKKPFSQSVIFKSIYSNNNLQKPIVVRSRNSIIFPLFLGITFSIYNGKKFINIQIHEGMIGSKFGDFVLTRKKAIHNKK